MEALGLKAIAMVLVLVQALMCLLPSGASLCIAQGDWCPAWGAASYTQPEPEPAAACCGGCTKERPETPLPRPIPTERECPKDCDCCIDVAIHHVKAVVDVTLAAKSDVQVALIAVVVAATGGQAEADSARVGLPPPDRPWPDWARGLKVIRLQV